jgi:zinc D-Ala-D-Ala dipeptidase
MQMRIASALALCVVMLGCASTPRFPPLPEGFVFLAQVDPTIRQDMRYAGTTNFIGRRVDGYNGPHCIVTRQAADGLKRAQASLRPKGLTLVVFDCYRPARAVADFMAWTQTSGPPDPVWRPNVAKDRLVPDGYIAARSGHSRGSTIDLGLAWRDPKRPDTVPRQSPCARSDMDTLDFGTPFDCFDPASATRSEAVSQAARTNRDLLLTAMLDAGFRNYAAEWWHFTLVDEPFSSQFFDFPIPELR